MEGGVGTSIPRPRARGRGAGEDDGVMSSLEVIPGFYMNKQTMVRIKPRKYDIAWNSHVLVRSVVEAKSRSSCKVPHPNFLSLICRQQISQNTLNVIHI